MLQNIPPAVGALKLEKFKGAECMHSRGLCDEICFTALSLTYLFPAALF